MSRFVTLKTPAELVVTLRTTPVPSLATSTVAAGTRAPLGSFTVPVKDPKVLWARLADAARKPMRIGTITKRLQLDIFNSLNIIRTSPHGDGSRRLALNSGACRLITNTTNGVKGSTGSQSIWTRGKSTVIHEHRARPRQRIVILRRPDVVIATLSSLPPGFCPALAGAPIPPVAKRSDR